MTDRSDEMLASADLELDEGGWERLGIEPDLRQAVRSTHRRISDVDWRYRLAAAADPAFLERRSYEALDRYDDLLVFRLQSWPTFVSRAWVDELASASERLNRLLRSVPQRFFDNDPERVCEFYRFLDPSRLQVLLSEPNGIGTMASRGDFIDTADGLKLIEFNFTPSLGGWESTLLVSLQLESPPTRRFLAEHGLEARYTNTMERLFRWALREVRDRSLGDGREINVAFLFDPPEGKGSVRAPEGRGYFREEYRSACRHEGVAGDVFLAMNAEVTFDRYRLFYEGRRIHAVVDLTRRPTDTELYRCFKLGGLLLLNDPVDMILGDKRNLALLSEHTDSGLLSAEESELVRRYVPWTRRLDERQVERGGRRLPLRRLVLEEKDHMVLKRGMDYGGKGVRLGRVSSPEEWERVVDAALEEGVWVAQEALESRPYLYQNGERGCSPHDAIWGPFVFGDEYAGAILRVQPKAAGGAVNLSLEATEGVVLEA